MRYCYWIAIIILCVINGGCGRTDADSNAKTIEYVIRTTSAPVDALTRDIVKGLVPVELLCPLSEDPNRWRPTPEVVSRYQRAQLIITNGAGYEDWVRTAPLPRSRVIDASSTIHDQLIVIQGEAHSHGPSGSHSHQTVLGTVWLDPMHAISQAEVITDALVKSFPEYQSEFKSNLNALSEELLSLHEKMMQIDFSQLTVIAPLNPYGYLANQYDWDHSDIGMNPEDWPMEIHSLKLTTGKFENKPTLILCEDPPSPESADTHLQIDQIFRVQWKTIPSQADGTFIEFHSTNVQNLESTINSLDN